MLTVRGGNDGRRWAPSPSFRTEAGLALPPCASTCRSAPPIGPKTIMLFRLQAPAGEVPPIVKAAPQRTAGEPPLKVNALELARREKCQAIGYPGDQMGLRPPSVPGSARVSRELRDRTQSICTPLRTAANATWRPSGDMANSGAVPANCEPRLGSDRKLHDGGSPRVVRCEGRTTRPRAARSRTTP